MLITDQVATAPCTDRVQGRRATFEVRPHSNSHEKRKIGLRNYDISLAKRKAAGVSSGGLQNLKATRALLPLNSLCYFFRLL